MVNFDTDTHPPSQWIRGTAYEGLMKIVRIKGLKVDSKWAQMDIVGIHVRGLRLQTNLKLPCGYQVIWEFQVNEGQDTILNVRGVVVNPIRLQSFEGIHLYEARFSMDEQHPLIIQRNESYRELTREKKAKENQRFDLLG